MNRWWGTSDDSQRQASERTSRAARRTISRLPQINLGDSSDDEYEDCNLSNSFILNLDGADDVDEEVAIMPAVRFDTEDGTDDAEYYKKLSTLKNREFNKKEPEFWFNSIEASLKHIGLKSQWSKREVLHNLLPEDVQIQVKHILKKDQDSAGTTPCRRRHGETP